MFTKLIYILVIVLLVVASNIYVDMSQAITDVVNKEGKYFDEGTLQSFHKVRRMFRLSAVILISVDTYLLIEFMRIFN